MIEEPHKRILNRDESRKNIQDHFKPQLELLGEIVNYGTNLIVRCYRTSDRDMTAAIILGGMLKQFVAMLDAVEILTKEGAVLAAQVPDRSLFEESLYIEWVLSSDTDNRVKHYYVWHLRQEREWAARLIPNTNENKRFLALLEEYPLMKEETKNPEIIDQAKKNIAKINNILYTAS